VLPDDPNRPSPPAQPLTGPKLGHGLRALGVRNAGLLLVHSSLCSLGFVVGGPVAVVQALLDVLGPDGTLVVPTFTSSNGDPSRWARTRKQAVPQEWWQTIRDHLPAFDPRVTPSEGVGVIAETVRTWPGAYRSDHPQTSFAAIGRDARRITAGHHRDCHLGPDSPLGRLAETDGTKILLLGVPYAVCTAFHLGEYLRPDPPMRDYECVVLREGERAWYRFTDVSLDDGDFQRLGEDFEAAAKPGTVLRGRVGDADCRLLDLRAAVAFTRDWLPRHRRPPGERPGGPSETR
jgi:aminoglycoside 3-N-acetyltransferase